MDLGICWENGVWANGSWVDGTWCPSTPCTPASIGDCWQVVWCSGSWATNSWCTSTPPVPPAPVVVPEGRRWAGPSTLLYTDDVRMRQRREEEEYLFL
jgi:hypothetical protein